MTLPLLSHRRRAARLLTVACATVALQALAAPVPAVRASPGRVPPASGSARAPSSPDEGVATFLPGGLRTIIASRLAHGPSFSLVGERYRLHGRDHFAMQIDIEHGNGGEPARGARTGPLGWSFWTGCHPREFAVLYGLLKEPRDTVLARVGGVLRPLRQVAIPSSLDPGGVLVYAVLDRLPRELVVRAGGRTVLSESLAVLAGENTAVCEAEIGPAPGQGGLLQSPGQSGVGSLIAGARKIYADEIGGVYANRDLRFIAGDSVLLEDLSRGELAAAEAEVHLQMTSNPGLHITRVSVLRAGRMLINAVWNSNGSFVVAPVTQALRLHGRNLGTLLVSIQDVVGYVKLIKRLLGAEAVVRGSSGQVRTLLPAAAHTPLPGAGSVDIAGAEYGAGTFQLGGWRGETLTVWVLRAL